MSLAITRPCGKQSVWDISQKSTKNIFGVNYFLPFIQHDKKAMVGIESFSKVTLILTGWSCSMKDVIWLQNSFSKISEMTGRIINDWYFSLESLYPFWRQHISTIQYWPKHNFINTTFSSWLVIILFSCANVIFFRFYFIWQERFYWFNRTFVYHIFFIWISVIIYFSFSEKIYAAIVLLSILLLRNLLLRQTCFRLALTKFLFMNDILFPYKYFFSARCRYFKSINTYIRGFLNVIASIIKVFQWSFS